MTATATIRDRYGLAISTTSTAAAEHYVEGVDLLLEQGYGTEQCFQQAIEADEGFALAYAGLSMMQMLRGAAADAKASVAKAQQLARRRNPPRAAACRGRRALHQRPGVQIPRRHP